MASLFSASEVVEMGIQIEKNGNAFYKGVAALSKNDKAKKLFEFLAREEERHIKRFEAILSKVKRYEPSQAYPDEYFSYIKALSAAHIFTKENKGAEIAKKVNSDSEAIKLAVDFEKESIVFYQGIKKVVLEAEQNIIDRLLEEEKDHLRRLQELV